MPDISVIIPVFNRISVLERAVKSVTSQTFQSLEILLIDDGSTDGSSELCDILAETDNRIRVIHQQNQGVSAARNAGIAAATGTYIGFVDSDDYIQPTMYQCMLETMEAKKVDLVVCGVANVNRNRSGHISRKESICCEEQTLTGGEQVFDATIKLLTGSLMHWVWNKLYKTDIIKNNEFVFPRDISLGEDLLFNLQYLKAVEAVHLISDCQYVYLSDEQDGSMAKFRQNKHALMSLLYKNVMEYAVTVTTPTVLQSRQMAFLYIKWTYSCFIDLFYKSCPLSKKDKHEYINQILANNEVGKAAELACGCTGFQKRLSSAVYKKNTNLVYFYSYFMFFIKFRLYRFYSFAMGFIRKKGKV